MGRTGHGFQYRAAVYPSYYNFATGADVAVDGQGNATAVFMVWTTTPAGAVTYPLQSAQLKAGSGSCSKAVYVTGKSQNIYNFSVDAAPLAVWWWLER